MKERLVGRSESTPETEEENATSSTGGGDLNQRQKPRTASRGTNELSRRRTQDRQATENANATPVRPQCSLLIRPRCSPASGNGVVCATSQLRLALQMHVLAVAGVPRRASAGLLSLP
jgi:hypothetical protein